MSKHPARAKFVVGCHGNGNERLMSFESILLFCTLTKAAGFLKRLCWQQRAYMPALITWTPPRYGTRVQVTVIGVASLMKAADRSPPLLRSPLLTAKQRLSSWAEVGRASAAPLTILPAWLGTTDMEGDERFSGGKSHMRARKNMRCGKSHMKKGPKI